MDFTLSKEHEMARQLFKEFAENEVKPLAQEVDETETFPRETVEKMAKYGFMGIPVPKEYGGQGCDTLTDTPQNGMGKGQDRPESGQTGSNRLYSLHFRLCSGGSRRPLLWG